MTDSNGTEKMSRRKLLAGAGIGAAGLAVPGVGLVSASNNSNRVSRAFDPSKKENAADFLRALGKENRETQRKKLSNLSPRERKVAKQVSTVSETVSREDVKTIETDSSAEMAIQGFDDYSRRTVSYWVGSKNAIGDFLWRYYQDLTYDWWYEEDVEVVSVNSYAQVYYPTWQYNGEESRNVVDYGTHADSFTQGEFQSCITQFGCWQSKYPFIELRCFSKGGAQVERWSV